MNEMDAKILNSVSDQYSLIDTGILKSQENFLATEISQNEHRIDDND